jgi:GTPase SAR1 family protein
VQYWINETDAHAGPHVCRLLVGNKADLHAKRAVAAEEGTALARQFGILFMETSALNSSNVDTMFLMIARAMKKNANKLSPINNNKKRQPVLNRGVALRPAIRQCCPA